jgi:hypothetical protein
VFVIVFEDVVAAIIVGDVVIDGTYAPPLPEVDVPTELDWVVADVDELCEEIFPAASYAETV